MFQSKILVLSNILGGVEGLLRLLLTNDQEIKYCQAQVQGQVHPRHSSCPYKFIPLFNQIQIQKTWAQS